MKLLALDFDGVISDSAPEAFVVALRTWCELHPDSPFRELRALLEGATAPAIEAIRGEPLYAAFLDAMALGNRAEDYAVELSAFQHTLPRDKRPNRRKPKNKTSIVRTYCNSCEDERG